MTLDLPSMDEMIAELKSAGWRMFFDNDPTIWQTPDGRCYRGPFRAWQTLTGYKPQPPTETKP